MLEVREIENFMQIHFLDEYMVGHKGFIAGGCFKNIFNGERIKDIDVFFENETDLHDAIQYFDSQTANYEGDDTSGTI